MANSKNPKAPTPASAAASEMTTLTGLPVSSSSPPALPANASGIRSRDGGRARRRAITTTMGMRAAAVPFRPMSAVSTAASIMTRTSSFRQPPVERPTIAWATHAVTPLESSDSDTTKSAAMKITAGSPKPPSASGKVSTPVA